VQQAGQLAEVEMGGQQILAAEIEDGAMTGLPSWRKASTTRTYSCLTPLPPAARTTRKNMVSSETCPCERKQTNQISASANRRKSRNIGKISVPTFLQKPSVHTSKINDFLRVPAANMSNMG